MTQGFDVMLYIVHMMLHRRCGCWRARERPGEEKGPGRKVWYPLVRG